MRALCFNGHDTGQVLPRAYCSIDDTSERGMSIDIKGITWLHISVSNLKSYSKHN